jgi:lysophospholipase L1-like esterase
MRVRKLLGWLLGGALGYGALGVAAQPAQAPDARWRDTFSAFAEADRLRMPEPGGIVFVGSSSIRLWPGLESQFSGSAPVVIKRGFGGSRLADCAENLGQLVTQYKPRQVVVYAGENDLTEGRTPRQVFDSFVAFVRGVHDLLPETQITYVSIKPSPLRAALMPQVREANRLIAEYVADRPRLDYIDVYSKMIDSHGRARSDLFVDDALHLNAAGYALWREEIASRLR